MTPARAIIFDLDGTLVDSLQDITNALNCALQQMKRAGATLDQVRTWVGDGIISLCQRALPDADPVTLQHLIQLAQQHYLAHSTDCTTTYPNILPMLKLLKSRHIPIAVLSNKPHALTLEVIQRLGLGDYFDELRGCTQEQDKKPSPHAALALARQWGIAPASILLVGDSPVDVATARNAGMMAVAVTWGFRSREELSVVGPDYFLDDPLQISGLLEK